MAFEFVPAMREGRLRLSGCESSRELSSSASLFSNDAIMICCCANCALKVEHSGHGWESVFFVGVGVGSRRAVGDTTQAQLTCFSSFPVFGARLRDPDFDLVLEFPLLLADGVLDRSRGRPRWSGCEAGWPCCDAC